MDTQIAWYFIIGTITLAFGFSLWGLQAAKGHGIRSHAVWMVVTAGIVCIWLLGYVSKQILFGRERFGGSAEVYYGVYMPIFLLHTACAVTTVALWGYNLYQGVRSLKQRAGKTAAVPGRNHRAAGRAALMSFGATVLTSYLVYLMLFVWYPASAPVIAEGFNENITDPFME